MLNELVNETKEFKTRVHEGREILVGAIWKWGPGFAKTSESKVAKPNGSAKTRH